MTPKEKRKINKIKYYNSHPWMKTFHNIIKRCSYKKHHYYKKGIKNFLTQEDIKYLWSRDRAYLLKKPSIDRIDSKRNYTLENCRYIELSDNHMQKNLSCCQQDNCKGRYFSKGLCEKHYHFQYYRGNLDKWKIYAKNRLRRTK